MAAAGATQPGRGVGVVPQRGAHLRFASRRRQCAGFGGGGCGWGVRHLQAPKGLWRWCAVEWVHAIVLKHAAHPPTSHPPSRPTTCCTRLQVSGPLCLAGQRQAHPGAHPGGLPAHPGRPTDGVAHGGRSQGGLPRGARCGGAVCACARGWATGAFSSMCSQPQWAAQTLQLALLRC